MTMRTITKNLEINEFLIRELDAAQKQLTLFKENKPGKHDVPSQLAGRINWLRGYAKAIKNINKLQARGLLEGINIDNYRDRIEQGLEDVRSDSQL